MVEHRTVNAGVAGSSPALAVFYEGKQIFPSYLPLDIVYKHWNESNVYMIRKKHK